MAKNETLPDEFDCVKFWQQLRAVNRIPLISSVVLPIVMMLVSFVDVE
jgi:hypothetical protein